MADLTAKFRLVDEMSDKLEHMAESGQEMAGSWEQAGNAAGAALGSVSSAATGVATSIDGVASSINSVSEDIDYWTQAVGDYDKSLLEATYTTQELVEQGFKTADALQAEEEMLELCERSSSNLSNALEATTDIENELTDAIEQASEAGRELADSDKLSAEAKEELNRASEAATEALQELAQAQAEAEAAMESYDAVIASETNNLNELEAAAERAQHAAENLEEANGKAADATEELAKAAEKAANEAENSGDKGVNAIENIESALVAAGITVKVKEIAEAAYELAEAFSEAESTVVKATGATGDALDGLTTSMMNAYAASRTGSLDETAAAVGEINTRLGYTDEILSDTTVKFLDFASATGGNAAGSVRSVTQLMNQWNVSADDLSLMLDKLTYAGQVSGISVDGLTSQLTSNKAVLDQLGFSLEESIALFSNFELSGTQAASVMTGFRTALSNGSISSLEELYTVFEDIQSGAIGAADAADIFGARAGTAIVNAVNTGVLSLDQMTAAIEGAGGTLETTVNAAQTMGEKWEQATNNVSTAFSQALSPAIESATGVVAGFVNGIGTFLNEHPLVTKAITAGAIAIGVLAAGIAGVTFVTTVAIPAVTAFGVALNLALGPIGWVALGITAVTVAVGAFITMMDDAEDETAEMTAVTRQQYYELQDLNAEYEETCKKYGETSEEALRLKYQVDDLSAAFEANRQTVEEFTAEVDALCESAWKLSDDFNTALKDINSQEVGALALIQRYEDLATQAALTGAQEEELSAITKKLSENYPDLAAKLDSATMSAEDYVAAMERACEQQTEQLRQQQAQDTFTEALQKQAELEAEIAKAEANLNAEREARGIYYDEYMQQWKNSWYTEDSPWASLTTDLDEYNDALDELLAAQAENEAVLAKIRAEWEEVAKAEAEAAEAVVSYEDAVDTALGSVQENIENLITAYNESYEAARNSIDSTIGLFDTMAVECEISTQDMIAALESQTEYLNQYAENLKQAAEYGLDDGLIASLSDGSTESAAYLDTIISKIDELGGATDEAKAFIDEMNSSFAEVEAAKDTFAKTVADMETNFAEEMNKLTTTMEGTVQDLNMDTEAAEAATATIQAYADAITAQKGSAVSAAEQVASAVATALSSTKISVSTSTAASVEHNATGTTNSADVFIAGEEGPELVVGHSGSTVFPAEETEKIIDAVGRRPLYAAPPEAAVAVNGQSDSRTQSGDKKITLEIAGSGALNVEAGTTKEQILELIYDNLKPALMNIVQSEIYEEGDLSYDY